MKNLMAYKTNLGMYIAESGSYGYTSAFTSAVGSLDRWKVNGKLLSDIAQPTHFTKWVFLQGVDEIMSIEDLKRGNTVTTGFTLKIPTLANEEIPLNLSIEQVEQYWNNDLEDWAWKNYNEYRALYKPVTETLPDSWEPIEFSVNVIQHLQIDKVENPIEMKVGVMDTGGWTSKSNIYELSSIVRYSDIEKMLTPEFLLHERPCSLSSEQVYKIVRDYVRTHIDGKYARITSDYDFCFDVCRKIGIKPFTKRVSVRKTPRSQPKYVNQSVEHKEVKLFEMTYSPKNYSGYTPIQGWQANNLKEMAEQVRSYLTELMDEINRPVQECSACGGTGCVDAGKIETNKR
jgi:hypothetical protein